MFAFITAGPNAVFAVALGLLLVIFVIELCGLLFGSSLSGALGDIDMPDFDVPDAALHDVDLGVMTKFLCWLKIGRVPLLILLVIFLAAFAIAGYLLQWLFFRLFGFLLPGLLAVPAAALLSVPLVRVFGGGVAKVIPRDESAAVSLDGLVGSRAVIILGAARRGSPAQGRLKDKFGTTHYLMIEPDDAGEVFERGREVILLRHDGGRFFAIAGIDSPPE